MYAHIQYASHSGTALARRRAGKGRGSRSILHSISLHPLRIRALRLPPPQTERTTSSPPSPRYGISAYLEAPFSYSNFPKIPPSDENRERVGWVGYLFSPSPPPPPQVLMERSTREEMDLGCSRGRRNISPENVALKQLFVFVLERGKSTPWSTPSPSADPISPSPNTT